MHHCHILEHHEAGMMAHFEIVEGTEGGGATLAGSIQKTASPPPRVA